MVCVVIHTDADTGQRILCILHFIHSKHARSPWILYSKMNTITAGKLDKWLIIQWPQRNHWIHWRPILYRLTLFASADIKVASWWSNYSSCTVLAYIVIWCAYCCWDITACLIQLSVVSVTLFCCLIDIQYVVYHISMSSSYRTLEWCLSTILE